MSFDSRENNVIDINDMFAVDLHMRLETTSRVKVKAVI